MIARGAQHNSFSVSQRSNPRAVAAGLSAVRQTALNFSSLTRSQKRELERRERIVEAFDALIAKGLTKADAARELRTGSATIWRWKNRRIVPNTANCGVKSALEKFNPPAALLALVRQLQLGGKSNAAAWLAVADDPRCPAELRNHLKAGHVAPSLLAATKLKRRKVTIIEAPGILVLKQ
jgi:hypothetical protein